MKEKRGMIITLLVFSAVAMGFAGMFHLKAEKLRAEADALKAEGVAIQAADAAQRATKAEKDNLE